MPKQSITTFFERRTWAYFITFCFFKTCLTSWAQDESSSGSSLEKDATELQLGPLHLHPALTTGVTYDDNITFSPTSPMKDVIWSIHPGIQAVAGDDAALINYRDMNYDILSLSPGDVIIQPPEDWPGKLLILDYDPNFKFYDRYTTYNFANQYATVNLMYAMSRLILGFNQNYTLEKTAIIQIGQIATEQTIHSKVTAAYLLSDKTSMEGNFNFIDISYDQPGLTGYTEYNTEDWLNYAVIENLPVSAGILAGFDDVIDGQNQTYQQLRARARYNYSEKLRFDASVGGELRQYENGHSQTLSPVFSVTGIYQPTVLTTLSLTSFRQQYASLYDGFYDSKTGVALELRQGLTDRFMVDASFGNYFLDYTPINNDESSYSEDYYAVGLGLEAKIIRHLTGKISYQWQDRQSGHSGDASENQVNAQLTLSY
jgi:hypothetical protein